MIYFNNLMIYCEIFTLPPARLGQISLTYIYYIMHVPACSVVPDSLAIPQTEACQAPQSMGFPRQEYWSRLPFPWSFRPKDWTCVSCIASRFYTAEPSGSPYMIYIHTDICIYGIYTWDLGCGLTVVCLPSRGIMPDILPTAGVK